MLFCEYQHLWYKERSRNKHHNWKQVGGFQLLTFNWPSISNWRRALPIHLHMGKQISFYDQTSTNIWHDPSSTNNIFSHCVVFWGSYKRGFNLTSSLSNLHQKNPYKDVKKSNSAIKFQTVLLQFPGGRQQGRRVCIQCYTRMRRYNIIALRTYV